MPPPVGFDFETAKEILRLVKKNKNGSLNRPIEAEVQNLNNPQLVIAFIASPEITVYNDTYKIFRIPNAKMVPFNTGIEITNGRLAFGRTNDDGEILIAGINAIVGMPVIDEDYVDPPRIFAGHYLGVITGYSQEDDADFEKPIVLILSPPTLPFVESDPITVVTNVTCTPEGIQLQTAQFVASDYDSAVITSFLGLNDTPASYSAQQNRVVKVNSNADGLEFGVNNDTVETDISDMQAAIASIQDDITAIQSDISDIEGAITSIESDVSAIQADYVTLEARVTALE